jgi:hypothetical protein
MKFGKLLSQRMVPEWSDRYIRYKTMKGQLKSISAARENYLHAYEKLKGLLPPPSPSPRSCSLLLPTPASRRAVRALRHAVHAVAQTVVGAAVIAVPRSHSMSGGARSLSLSL